MCFHAVVYHIILDRCTKELLRTPIGIQTYTFTNHCSRKRKAEMTSNATKVKFFAIAMLYLMSQTHAACPETEYACANGPSGDDMCAWDGSSATYTESWAGSKHHDEARDSDQAVRRKIVATGCPNHAYVPVNPNCAGVQDYAIKIPAYPYFNGASYADALAAATDLSKEGGDVGLTLNGGAIYTAYAGSYDYDGDGDIDGDDVMSISSNAVSFRLFFMPVHTHTHTHTPVFRALSI